MTGQQQRSLIWIIMGCFGIPLLLWAGFTNHHTPQGFLWLTTGFFWMWVVGVESKKLGGWGSK